MNILKEIRTYDKSDMLHLLVNFPKQFREAHEIGNAFHYKADPSKIVNIVFAGMGGSAIGGDLIISCLKKELTVPAEVNRNYFLPHHVNQETLVIVSSFSGNTEETLSCYKDAKSRKAQIVCITSGGELKERADQDGVPVISIPGGIPPRTALGYLSVPVLLFLIKSGFASETIADFAETQKWLETKSEQYAPTQTKNFTLKLAEQIHGKIPVIYAAADMLNTAAMRWKGQFSENAKMLAFYNLFPELNHNEIVGWEQLPEMLKKLQIIYLQDNEDYERNKLRMNITKNILKSVTNPVIELTSQGNSRLTRLFSLIYVGDMVSFYLAILNGVDPTRIEKIQLLKDRLQKI